MITTEAPVTGSSGGLRIIPALDTMPGVVRFVQTVPGKLVLIGAFVGVQTICGSPAWIELSIILLCLSFFPQFRQPLVVAATVIWQVRVSPVGFGNPGQILASERIGTTPIDWPAWMAGAPVILLAVLVFAGVYLVAVERWGKRGPLRRPVATWLALYVLMLVFASHTPLSPIVGISLWAFLVVLGKYLWFITYSIQDLVQTKNGSLLGQVGFWRPFWGSTNVPFPRGALYLRKIEAKSAEELAVTQLKGLKLALWMGVLVVLQQSLVAFVHGHPADPAWTPWWLPGSLHLPHYMLTLKAHLDGVPYARSVCWVSVVTLFTNHMLSIAILGHMIISICRMAGYRALRNTYRPLESTSYADFFSRIYYYYKELLVQVFFFPTYLRYFTRSPRLRLIFATLVAVGFGNAFFHFLRDVNPIVRFGFFGALVRYRVALVYFVVVGIVLTVSQLRDHAVARTRQRPRRTLLTTFSILLFSATATVFVDPHPDVTAGELFSYVLRLYNPAGP